MRSDFAENFACCATSIHAHGEQIALSDFALNPLTVLIKENGFPIVERHCAVLIEETEGGEEVVFHGFRLLDVLIIVQGELLLLL